MNLIEKIRKLDAKRQALTDQLAAQADAENCAAGEVLAALVKLNPTAKSAATSDRVLSCLSKKSRVLFDSWLARHSAPVAAESAAVSHSQEVFVNKNSEA